MRRTILVLLAMLALSASAQQTNSAGGKAQVLISGGTLIDGTGSASRVADVRIVGDTIKEIGKLKPEPGEQVIDAKGLIVAPGFVDVHNHSERGFANDPTARTQILQGITTIAVGPDGGSPFPIAGYLSSLD